MTDNPLPAAGNPLDPAPASGPATGARWRVSRADGPTLTLDAPSAAAAVAEYRRQTGTVVTPAPFTCVPVA